ncbi:MAG: hypothetical protein RR263_04065, partial [Oscillospiraceae bacterium]
TYRRHKGGGIRRTKSAVYEGTQCRGYIKKVEAPFSTVKNKEAKTMANNSTWTAEEQIKIIESLQKLKQVDPEKYERISKSFNEKMKTNITPEIKFPK